MIAPAIFPVPLPFLAFSSRRKRKKGPRLITGRPGGAESPEDALTNGNGKAGEWSRIIAVVVGACGLMTTLWATFVKPTVLAEADQRAQVIVEKALKASDELRREQVDQIRRSIERITARLDRVDSTLASELRAMSAAVDELSKELRRK